MMDKPDVKRFQAAPFNPHEYVDIVSRKLVYQLAQDEDGTTDREGRRCDPPPTHTAVFFATEPFLKLFENTIADLKRMQDQVEEEIAKSIKGCAKEEEAYKSKIWAQNRAFQSNLSTFKDLDDRICGIGNIAMRIGDQLEAVEKQRSSASETKELINYFSELCSGEVKSPIFLHKGMLRERARLLKKLGVFVKEIERAEEEMSHLKAEHVRMLSSESATVDLAQGDPMTKLESLLLRTSKGKELVESESNKLENKLLLKFTKSSSRCDYETMREYANILHEFNGGASCVKRYISLLKMFFDTESLEMDEVLADQGTYTAKVQQLDSFELASARITQFYDEIIESCKKEYLVISRVFPNPPSVMRELAHRIFEQRISMFLERMLYHSGTAISMLTYLRLVVVAHEKIFQLVAVLREFKTDLDFDSIVASLLLNYIDSYLDTEIQCLSLLYKQELENLMKGADMAGKHGSAFDKMFEVSKDLATAWNLQGKKNPNLLNRVPELTTLEPILHFIHAHEESVRRCVKLSKPGTIPQSLQRLFDTLLDYLGYQYLHPALEAALEPLRAGRAGRVQFLEVVQQANQIVILLQRHFHVEIAPHASQSNSILAECINKKDRLLTVLEDKVSEGLELTLDLIIATLERQLSSEQGRNDFRLSEDDIIAINRPTAACINAVSYIAAQSKVVQANLDGKNVNIFLEELGLRLQTLLLEHFKRFTVSQGMGGMKLKRDVQEYQQCALSFSPFGPVIEAFEVLNDLASIHLVEAGQLRHLMEESALANLKRSQVMDYIKLRSDFKTAWVQQFRLMEDSRSLGM